MRKLSIIIIILSIYFHSCSTENKKDYNNNLEIIDITSGFITNKENIELSKISDNYKLIKLETTPECYISRIRKMVFTNDRIIIVDELTHQILLFDYSGKFLNKIGHIGKGPKEYSTIWDIAFDENNNILYVVDGSSKILKYKLPNIFLKEETNLFSRRIFFVNNKIAMFFGRDDVYLNGNLFAYLDTGLKKKTFFYDKYKNEIKSNNWLGLFSVYVVSDSLSYWSTNTQDTIFRIMDEDNILPRYVLSYNCNPMSHKTKQKFEVFSSSLDQTYISRILETGKYLFISGEYKRMTKQIIVDKNDLLVYSATPNKIWEYQYFFSSELNNDIDGGMKFWPKGRVNDNTVYSYFDIITMKAYFNERERHISEGSIKKINIKYPTKEKELKQLINNSTNDDNPVIMIVTLK